MGAQFTGQILTWCAQCPQMQQYCQEHGAVTTRYRPPGLSPGPRTPALPKPPPQPPQARTATRPTPPAITGHHRPSTPQPLPLTAPPAITAVTATSAPAPP
ncbi:hypothetical protein C0993_009777, partial [Termitomyces sp. T159_Od127]